MYKFQYEFLVKSGQHAGVPDVSKVHRTHWVQHADRKHHWLSLAAHIMKENTLFAIFHLTTNTIFKKIYHHTNL